MNSRFLLPAFVLLASVQAVATPGGELGTLPRGNYQCGTPGLAGEQPVHLIPELDFKVVNGSSYERDGVRGTYLHTGDDVVFTSGMMRGERFQRISTNMIRKLGDDGQPSELRCVRLGY